MSFVEKYFIINILFLIKLPTSNLASIDNSWLNPLVQWQPNGDLLISLFLLRLLKFCSELELSFLPCYLYIPCISMDLWLPVWCFFFFLVWFPVLCSVYQIQSVGAPSGWLPNPFDMSSSFFEYFLTLWYQMLYSHLEFSQVLKSAMQSRSPGSF